MAKARKKAKKKRSARQNRCDTMARCAKFSGRRGQLHDGKWCRSGKLNKCR